jgi:Spy/CpxP family protein refolding chaperone
MKRFIQFTLAAAVVAIAVSPALAQEQQRQPLDGYGSGVLLLIHTQKSVQEELKLSDEQVKKVTELWEQATKRPNFQGLSRKEIQQKLAERNKAVYEAVAKILDAKQHKRAKQIALQRELKKQHGLSFTLNNKEVAKALEITDEQKDKLREIRTKELEDSRGLGFDEEGRKKREEIRNATNEKVNAVLTAEQKTKLKNLQGEPFKGKIDFRQFFGGRDQRN